jgi:ribosomal protein L40E
MICPNCGAANQPGDEFCGTCGQPLPGAVGASAAAGSGFAPDVICWKCGRRNPPSRSFCMQCGEKLTAAGAAATGAAATGAGGAGVAGGQVTGPGAAPIYGAQGGPGASGGDNRLMYAIGAALVVGLLIIGGGAVIFFGLAGPSATPTPSFVAVVSPTPTIDPGLSPSPSVSNGLPTVPPSSSAGPLPTPTQVLPTLPPPEQTPRPTRSPRPTREPTPEPTPANCNNPTGTTRFMTFDVVDNPQWVLNDDRIWCLKQIIFIAGSGTGTLKLYLTNPVFLSPEWGYSTERIGWHEAQMPSDFASSVEYSPDLALTQPYPMLPQGTTIDFVIENCTTPVCEGTVQVGYENPFAPPLTP